MYATRLDLPEIERATQRCIWFGDLERIWGCSDSRYRHLVLSEREVLVEIIITITIYFPSGIVEMEVLESLDP